jgi:hypothetical protein
MFSDNISRLQPVSFTASFSVWLSAFLLSVMSISCVIDGVNDDKVSAGKKDTVSFSVTNKNSVHVVNYRFEKLPGNGQEFSFNYANESDSFAFLLDTLWCSPILGQEVG